jgi:hypothetical protein
MKKVTVIVQALGLIIGSGGIGLGSVLVYRGLHHQTAGSHTNFESMVVGAMLAIGGLIILSLLIRYKNGSEDD